MGGVPVGVTDLGVSGRDTGGESAVMGVLPPLGLSDGGWLAGLTVMAGVGLYGSWIAAWCGPG